MYSPVVELYSCWRTSRQAIQQAMHTMDLCIHASFLFVDLNATLPGDPRMVSGSTAIRDDDSIGKWFLASFPQVVVLDHEGSIGAVGGTVRHTPSPGLTTS